MADRPLNLFQPKQFVFVVPHPGTPGLAPPQLQGLITWANDQAKEILGKPVTIAPPTEEQQIVFSGEKLTPKLPRGDPPAATAFARPKVEQRQNFTLLFPNVGDVTMAELARLAWRLDRLSSDLRASQKINLQQVALNWLTSGSNGQGGWGGPGGRPFAYSRQGGTDPYLFKLPGTLNANLPNDGARGEGVDVAILDTAPDVHTLADAYQKWAVQQTDHPLIKRLLPSVTKDTDRLQIEYADYATLLRWAAFELLSPHDYQMSDHGLFAAGIINTIAPAAKLHLLEVLNAFGVGDVQSIAGGLRDVVKMIQDQIDNKETRKWVVNCSLVMSAPADDVQLQVMQHLVQTRGELHELDNLMKDADFGDWLLNNQKAPIEFLCDILYYYYGTRVVAAAGNDREKAQARPGPRYPAWSDSVLGVGALPRNAKHGNRFNTAKYSNKDDVPTSAGLTTLGGEENQGNQNNGVLGVFTGEFPQQNRQPNANGWAWWCGTSFATPIISGITAAVLSGPKSPQTAQDAIELMFGATNGITDDQEAVLDVGQA